MPGNPPSFGTVWHPLRAGMPAGQPHNEWTYISPGYPEGISVSELGQADKDTQRQAAYYWFVLNFKPYRSDAVDGLPVPRSPVWGGAFNSAPLNTHPINGLPRNNIARTIGWNTEPREPLLARTALQTEFENIIPPPITADLADHLPGEWVRVDGSPRAVPNISSFSEPQVLNFIVTRLDDLAAAFAQIAPTHGGIGHNEQPPIDLPLSVQEHAEAIEAINESKAALAGLTPDIVAFRIHWAKVGAASRKVGLWLWAKTELFIDEAVKSTGKMVGPTLAAAILATVSASIFYNARWVNEALALLKSRI